MTTTCGFDAVHFQPMMLTFLSAMENHWKLHLHLAVLKTLHCEVWPCVVYLCQTMAMLLLRAASPRLVHMLECCAALG